MKKLAYLGFFLLVGCQPEIADKETPAINDPALPEQSMAEESTSVSYAGREFEVALVEGDMVYQGDILIPEGQSIKIYEEGEKPTEKAAVITEGLWENNTVYYDIDPELPMQYRVTEAIEHWEANTPIRFVKERHADGYVYFTPGNSCSSYVGKLGGSQPINLASGCTTGSVIHEIGHAVGMWHEQSRADRDEYITIHWGNVSWSAQKNFEKYTNIRGAFESMDATPELDFNSIMMYSAYSFSRNGRPTITKKDGSIYQVQRRGLSTADIAGIERIYSKNTEPVYENGKFYTVNGLYVLRFYDDWFYIGPYGVRSVYLKNGVWYYR